MVCYGVLRYLSDAFFKKLQYIVLNDLSEKASIHSAEGTKSFNALEAMFITMK